MEAGDVLSLLLLPLVDGLLLQGLHELHGAHLLTAQRSDLRTHTHINLLSACILTLNPFQWLFIPWNAESKNDNIHT